MSILSYVKAAGVALALLVLNVAAAFGVMAIYGHFIEVGREASFYEQAAQRIAPWSSVFVGAVLFFLAAWFFGVRKPERSALQFALAFTAFYCLVDIVILAATGNLGVQVGIIALSLGTKFAAAFAGARVARRTA